MGKFDRDILGLEEFYEIFEFKSVGPSWLYSGSYTMRRNFLLTY